MRKIGLFAALVLTVAVIVTAVPASVTASCEPVSQVGARSVAFCIELPANTVLVNYYRNRGSTTYRIFQDEAPFIAHLRVPEQTSTAPYDYAWLHFTGDTYTVEYVLSDGSSVWYRDLPAEPLKPIEYIIYAPVMVKNAVFAP